MPQEASALEREPFDRVLILGEPHIGKSTSVVASAADGFGLGYVMNCGKQTGLLAAGRRSKRFQWDLIRDEKGMEEAIKVARRGCKEGKYKWVVIDDFNFYASWLEEALEDATRNEKGESDGRRYWPAYKQRLRNILLRCFDFKAHLYVISHFIETGDALIDGQTEKSGYGVLPLFSGTARKEIPGMFSDIVFMAPSTEDGTKRSFFINPTGVYGPTCLSANETREIDADVGALHDEFEKSAKAEKAKSRSRSASGSKRSNTRRRR
jgi:hypothetical protein